MKLILNFLLVLIFLSGVSFAGTGENRTPEVFLTPEVRNTSATENPDITDISEKTPPPPDITKIPGSDKSGKPENTPAVQSKETPEMEQVNTEELTELCPVPDNVYYEEPEVYSTPPQENTPEDTPVIEATPEPPEFSGYPVYFFGEEIFYITNAAPPHSAKERAAIITKRLETISDASYCRSIFINIVEEEKRTLITYKGKAIITLTDESVKDTEFTRQELAKEYAEKLKTAIERNVADYNETWLLLGIICSVIITLLTILFFRVTGTIHKKTYLKLDEWKKNRPTGDIKYQRFVLISEKNLLNSVIIFINFLHITVKIVAIYIYFTLIFCCFAHTDDMGLDLFYIVADSFRFLWENTSIFLPKFLYILLVIFISYNIIKFFGIIFTEVEREALKFPGFYKEWAKPTYNILRFFIILFTIVIIFPSLPGYETPAFKGISVLLGILISLGSTTVMSDIVAGIILIYMKAFETGDRIKVMDITGDVMEKSILATTVKTLENTCITIPNSKILANYVTNYTTLAKTEGVILNTTITIGYDAPWRVIHRVLIEAAKETENVMKEPAPFVLQTALNDFHVSYELRVFTDNPGEILKIYSELHQNIQDKFNQAGLEIMSPHYRAIRDGSKTTIPDGK